MCGRHRSKNFGKSALTLTSIFWGGEKIGSNASFFPTLKSVPATVLWIRSHVEIKENQQRIFIPRWPQSCKYTVEKIHVFLNIKSFFFLYFMVRFNLRIASCRCSSCWHTNQKAKLDTQAFLLQKSLLHSLNLVESKTDVAWDFYSSHNES